MKTRKAINENKEYLMTVEEHKARQEYIKDKINEKQHLQKILNENKNSPKAKPLKNKQRICKILEINELKPKKKMKYFERRLLPGRLSVSIDDKISIFSKTKRDSFINRSSTNKNFLNSSLSPTSMGLDGMIEKSKFKKLKKTTRALTSSTKEKDYFLHLSRICHERGQEHRKKILNKFSDEYQNEEVFSKFSEEVDDFQYAKGDKENFLQLFESYTCLGFTKRKKRLRLFQQNLINKKNANRMKKMKKLEISLRKEKNEENENGTPKITIPPIVRRKPSIKYHIHFMNRK